MSSSSQTIRRFVLTGAVAGITATGAWYGAGLKTQQERKKERQAHIDAAPGVKIEQMEGLRATLIKRKVELEAKIEELANKSNGSTGNGATASIGR